MTNRRTELEKCLRKNLFFVKHIYKEIIVDAKNTQNILNMSILSTTYQQGIPTFSLKNFETGESLTIYFPKGADG